MLKIIMELQLICIFAAKILLKSYFFRSKKKSDSIFLALSMLKIVYF